MPQSSCPACSVIVARITYRAEAELSLPKVSALSSLRRGQESAGAVEARDSSAAGVARSCVVPGRHQRRALLRRRGGVSRTPRLDLLEASGARVRADAPSGENLPAPWRLRRGDPVELDGCIVPVVGVSESGRGAAAAARAASRAAAASLSPADTSWRAGRGEAGGVGAAETERSMRSQRAPTLVPRAADTARAGILVPRIAFISGSGQGAMSAMLQTTTTGTLAPARDTAEALYRIAYGLIDSASCDVHTMTRGDGRRSLPSDRCQQAMGPALAPPPRPQRS